MSNYKVKVNNEVESREVQELFFSLGGVWSQSKNTSYIAGPMTYIYFNESYVYYGHDDKNDEYWFSCESSGKELTIQQLKDLVVLKRNSIDDATHECETTHNKKGYLTSDNVEYSWSYVGNHWFISSNSFESKKLKPINKPLKEYLVPQDNGKYVLTKATEKRVSDCVEIPEPWMDFVYKMPDGEFRYSDILDELKAEFIVWQRHTQPEELPFVDDEPKLNIPDELKKQKGLD